MEGAFTGPVSGVNVKSAYAHSFGALPDQTRYVDPKFGIDMRIGAQSDINLKDILSNGMVRMKALYTQTGGTGTAGYGMIPVYVDPRVVDTTRKETPLVELIPRVTNQGLTADYVKITAKGGGFTAAEDAAMSETNDTTERASTAIKYLYAVGRVTGQMQAAMPAYMLEGFQPQGGGLGNSTFGNAAAPNAKQFEVIMKARELRELEENLIVNGSTSTDSTQFNGIVALQSTTNVVDLNGAALTYDDIETAILYAVQDGGRPKLGVASPSVIKDIRKIIIDTYRFSPSDNAGGSLPFGIAPSIVLDTMAGKVPVIFSRFLSDTSGAKQIYFLDTDWIEMRVLQDMTYEDLAHTNDSNKFMLKIYECLIMRNTAFNSFIDDIL
jgi:hypothetical protein